MNNYTKGMMDMGSRNRGSNSPQFFQTRMGHEFYQGTMPSIEKSLKEILTHLKDNGNNALSDTEVHRIVNSIKDIANINAQSDFFKTMMGHKFYQSIMPQLAKEVKAVAQGMTINTFEIVALVRQLPAKYEVSLPEDKKVLLIKDTELDVEYTLTEIKDLKRFVDAVV